MDMMDAQKDIRDAIGAALPGVSPEVVAAVEALEKLGTTSTDDLQYIPEGDLLPLLKPIQARRLVAMWAQNSKYFQINSCATLDKKYVLYIKLQIKPKMRGVNQQGQFSIIFIFCLFYKDNNVQLLIYPW